MECPQCGLHFYQNPKPCTAVVLQNDAGEYLLVERAVEPKKGYWDFPGGFVEAGETFEESAIREVKEELGVTLQDLKYLGTYTDKYDYRGLIYDTLSVAYVGKIPLGQKIKVDDDVAGYKFFKKNELSKTKVAFVSMNKIIADLR